MKKKTVILGICIGLSLSLGIIAGFLYMAARLEASDPIGEVSAGESPASVYYDEHWQAIEAYYWSEPDKEFKSFNPDTSAQAPEQSVKLYEENSSYAPGTVKLPVIRGQAIMKVTKWRVHGHIHFE
ncbi:MAG: hypothetical protein AB1629_00360 [Candidatus Omnitrophota bacterium]